MSLFSDVTDMISPGVGSLISGGLGFLGQLNTNQTNADVAASNSAFNAEQAQLNRDFQANQVQQAEDYQTQMSNTAFQRSVKDMEAAGINPMLAYMKGGASTPSISPASGSTAQAQGYVAQNPVSAGVQAYQTTASAHQAEANVSLIDQNAAKIIEEIKNIPKEGSRLEALTAMLYEQKQLMFKQGLNETDVGNNLRQTLLNLRAQARKLGAESDLLDLDLAAAKKLDNFGREYKQYAPIVDLITSILFRRQ